MVPGRNGCGEQGNSMPVGFRHDDLRRRNRALLVSTIRRAGQLSRTDLAGLTKLSHSTISAISADLIAEGVLGERPSSETAAARRGRPQVALGLTPSAASALIMVLSLDRISAALVDYSGSIIEESAVRLPTQTASPDDLTGRLLAMARGMAATAGQSARGPVARAVLAIQGTTDALGRTMLWSPIAPGADVPFAALLEEALGVPATLENDCNMIALALRRKRPERYGRDFIALLLSHGIGMGMVLKGELFTGTHSSGGEFGHMVVRPDGARCRCGRQGCIEAYAGTYAIWRHGHLLADDVMPTAEIGAAEMTALAGRARAADGPERRAFARAGEAIGFGLGSLFALIDPAPVAIVGQGAHTFDLIEPALRRAIARTAGGQHLGAISFATEADEMPLILSGAAMRALTAIDEEIVAPGPGAGA